MLSVDVSQDDKSNLHEGARARSHQQLSKELLQEENTFCRPLDTSFQLHISCSATVAVCNQPGDSFHDVPCFSAHHDT